MKRPTPRDELEARRNPPLPIAGTRPHPPLVREVPGGGAVATPWMIAREVAVVLGMPVRTVYAHVARGALPATRLGTKMLRFHVGSVIEYGERLKARRDRIAALDVLCGSCGTPSKTAGRCAACGYTWPVLS